MSWRKIRLAGSTGGNAAARVRFPIGGRLRNLSHAAIVILVAMINSWGLTTQLAAQENPLREGDAGYLQQLLPSLQKIQAESNANDARGASAADQFTPESLPVKPSGNEPFGSQSNAGLWRPEPTPQSTEAPAAAFKTEARLADSRPIAPWPEVGGISDSSNAPGVGKSSAKTAAPATGAASLSKGSTARAEGAGKLAAFKGIESLKLDSTVVKIGLNTLLVLAASIGLIVVVRRTMPRQAPAAKSPTGRLRIEQTLSLGGKAELKVIRCGLHQVLVAIDNGGIKSVVALEPSLEPERENLEPAVESQPPASLKEPVNIEQFVKMIRDMEGDLMSARPGR